MPSKHTKRAKHKAEENQHSATASNTYGAGFMLAAVGYCILAFFPLTPARFWWWLLAILVIPALTGRVAARGTSRTDSPAERFASGFWTCVIPMLVYVGIRLMVTHSRVGPSGHAIGVLFVSMLVTVVFALAAAIVAGMAGVIFYRQADRRGGAA